MRRPLLALLTILTLSCSGDMKDPSAPPTTPPVTPPAAASLANITINSIATSYNGGEQITISAHALTSASTPVANVSITFAVSGGSVSPATAITTADGLAETGWTLPKAAGAVEITASSGAFTRRITTEVKAAVIVDAGPSQFTLVSDMSGPRVYHTATLLRDGLVLIAGGQTTTDGGRSYLLTAELFNPATGDFTRVGNMVVARATHSATLLPDGKVLISGGSNGDQLLNSSELFDPATRSFTRTADMLEPQSSGDGTLLGNGKVLMTGGYTQASCCTHTARAELYDPATGTFSYTGEYADLIPISSYNGLVAIRPVLLADGKVLIPSLPRAEIYDPATGTFTATGAMKTNTGMSYIVGHTATLLSNGRVLVTGGEHEDVGRFSQSELYDAASGQFTFTASLPSPRTLHTATLLNSGQVLITGGETFNDCVAFSCAIFSTSDAHLYNATGATLTSAGSMRVPRENHTATLLKDGRVLITGGLTFNGGFGRTVSYVSLAKAEIYTP